MEELDAGNRLGGAHEPGPPRGLELGLRRKEELGLRRDQELPGSGVEEPSPGPLAGTPRWKHDRDIPWAVEAQAWEALDPG